MVTPTAPQKTRRVDATAQPVAPVHAKVLATPFFPPSPDEAPSNNAAVPQVADPSMALALRQMTALAASAKLKAAQVNSTFSTGPGAYKEFHQRTQSKALVDVLGLYPHAVAAANDSADKVNYQQGGKGVDAFLSPHGSFNFTHLVQGDIRDCFLVATLTGLLAKDPGRLNRMISPDRDGYIVRLHKPTSFSVTDEQGKVVGSAKPTGRTGNFNGPAQNVWVSRKEVEEWHGRHHGGQSDKTLSTVEAAAAKLMGPDYLNGGNARSAMYMVTGENARRFGGTTKTETQSLQQADPAFAAMDNHQLFSMTEKALQAGLPITLGIADNSADALGLPSPVQHHEFSLLEADPEGVVVRDPRGTGEPGENAMVRGDGIMTLTWDQVRGGFSEMTLGNAAPPDNATPQSLPLIQARVWVQNKANDSAMRALAARNLGIPNNEKRRAEAERFARDLMNPATTPGTVAQIYYDLAHDPDYLYNVLLKTGKAAPPT